MVLETWEPRWALLRPGESSATRSAPGGTAQGRARRRRPPEHPEQFLLVQEHKDITSTAGNAFRSGTSRCRSTGCAVLEHLVQDGVETCRAGVELLLPRCDLRTLLEQLVGDVEGGEDRHLGERRDGQLLGDLAH